MKARLDAKLNQSTTSQFSSDAQKEKEREKQEIE